MKYCFKILLIKRCLVKSFFKNDRRTCSASFPRSLEAGFGESVWSLLGKAT
jgi:hypothetical protein